MANNDESNNESIFTYDALRLIFSHSSFAEHLVDISLSATGETEDSFHKNEIMNIGFLEQLIQAENVIANKYHLVTLEQMRTISLFGTGQEAPLYSFTQLDRQYDEKDSCVLLGSELPNKYFIANDVKHTLARTTHPSLQQRFTTNVRAIRNETHGQVYSAKRVFQFVHAFYRMSL